MKLTPLQAHRLRCLECMGWDPGDPESRKPYKDVRECPRTGCFAWPFRMGKNPHHPLTRAKRIMDNLRKGKSTPMNPQTLSSNSLENGKQVSKDM